MTPNGRAKVRAWWERFRVMQWATSSQGIGYWRALDDVYDALDPHNPCHDQVRDWITRRRKEMSP